MKAPQFQWIDFRRNRIVRQRQRYGPLSNYPIHSMVNIRMMRVEEDEEGGRYTPG
jgi:hypothetical protein